MASPPKTGPERSTAAAGKWIETTLGIIYVIGENVQFYDDHDHWRNGFCRLLEIPEAQARTFVEQAVASARENFGKLFSDLDCNEKLACLSQATERTLYRGERPSGSNIEPSWGADPDGTPADCIYAYTISGDRTRIVAGVRAKEYAWLVDAANNKPVTADSIVYDTAYFSASGDAHYGMKHYIDHAGWRLEKARRLMGTVIEQTQDKRPLWRKHPQSVKLLDIGSGIGYYRKAADELGFQHYGIDLSSDIIALCKAQFGFDTWQCHLMDLEKVAAGMRVHLITLWDVIEHLEKPREAVALLKQYLADDGAIVIRTPNLSALDADILGDYYYSFKFDHVRYFSVKSLNALMSDLSLAPLYLETASHLFKGFLGADALYKAGLRMKGADILAIYEKS
ncbi:MAG TPA: class I SAM-dependent methyltransferase [Candidatus Obscuribacterales bacterium]